MYKGHVVFLGRGSVTSNRFWNGFVTYFPVIRASPETLQGRSYVAHLFRKSTSFSQSIPLLRYCRKNYLEDLTGMLTQAKLVLQPAFSFFLKFHENINTSPPKLTIANMSIKTPKTHTQIGFCFVLFFSCLVFKVMTWKKSQSSYFSHKLQETRGAPISEVVLIFSMRKYQASNI